MPLDPHSTLQLATRNVLERTMDDQRLYLPIRDRQPTHGGRVAPIDRLPPEILAELFVFCAAVDPYSLPRIARACCVWRNIVYDWPRIWFNLFLDQEHKSIYQLHRQAELWAKHSFPLTIDVEINLADADMMLAVLSPLLEHAGRWRTFKVWGNWVECIQMSHFPKNPGRVPLSLERLELFIDQELKEELGERPYVPKPNRPTFQFIDAEFVAQIFTSTLPRHDWLESMHITTLIINDHSDVIHPVELLKLLTVFPRLAILNVACWPQSETYDYSSAPIVKLLDLTKLSLRGLFSTRAVLSRLCTPSLKELTLGLLNVDHRLSDDFDYEPGDSEDEAQDFSQSPSSDHATGMGLRSLIGRCNPPLESLYMDYADMRTKDFRWCFDRLLKLQMFGIVASDMSDNVIRLLTPCWETVESGRTGMRLRLPLLKTLTLRNCQRLSGEAVLMALQTRVQYTDSLAKDGTYSTLQEVHINGCDGIRDHHLSTLEKNLGSRLLLS